MRALTAKQKKVLETYALTCDANTIASDTDALPSAVWATLEELNNTEVLFTNVNQWLWDKAMSLRYD